MSEGLERIAAYLDEFCQSVEACRASPPFRSLDWKAAYSALGRMRDRYRHERDALTLTPEERTALQKVFEDDTFIEGLMDFRQVGEHVIRRGGPVIRTTSNQPVQLTVEASAMAVFAGPIVVLPDIAGAQHKIDHLQLLGEAQRRISAAVDSARTQ